MRLADTTEPTTRIAPSRVRSTALAFAAGALLGGLAVLVPLSSAGRTATASETRSAPRRAAVAAKTEPASVAAPAAAPRSGSPAERHCELELQLD